LFTTDVYVPLSAVTNITDEGIYLNVRKDDIDQQGWTRPPAEDTAATDTYGDATGLGSGAPTIRDQGDTRTLERSEERIVADKHRVQTGQVEVGKRVVADEQSMDVPVTRDEVHVTRRAVDRPATDADFDRQNVSIPVTEERADARKEARVVEELDIDKGQVQDTQRVSGTVRREEFDIDDEDATRR
jgi:uncharacterized protein (TIGR02271 family)